MTNRRQMELPLVGTAPAPARKAPAASTTRPATPEPAPEQLILQPRAAYVLSGSRPGLPEHYLAWYDAGDGERVGQITVPAPLAAAIAELHVRQTRPLVAGPHALPELAVLGPHLRRELYDRDGGHADPRRRFELDLPSDSPLVAVALSCRCACAACGAAIHPFRQRKKSGKPAARPRRAVGERLYVAVACPLDVSVGCSRGDAAADAYVDLEQALVAGGWL
jgi:hypothetical protein